MQDDDAASIPDARERDVQLAVGEDRRPKVGRAPRQSLTLGFVDGEAVAQSQRVLTTNEGEVDSIALVRLHVDLEVYARHSDALPYADERREQQQQGTQSSESETEM